jgi:hypothetical protein
MTYDIFVELKIKIRCANNEVGYCSFLLNGVGPLGLIGFSARSLRAGCLQNEHIRAVVTRNQISQFKEFIKIRRPKCAEIPR